MAEGMKTKIKSYKTAPFDSRFPNQNQTRNCCQNYLDFHAVRRQWLLKGEMFPCANGTSVYKSLCPIAWVSAWDDHQAEGTFPGKT